MTFDPYETPKADLETQSVNKNEGAPIKAIFIAVIVDYGGTVIFSFILGLTYSILLLSGGMTPEELELRLVNINILSPLYLLGVVIGLSITAFSGYLCARIARRRNYRAVSIYLTIMVVIGSATTLVRGGDIVTLEFIASTAATVLSGYLGAWLYINKYLKKLS